MNRYKEIVRKLESFIIRLRCRSPLNREDLKFVFNYYRMPGAILRAKKASGRTGRDEKLVVFVSRTPREREARLAWGLKSAGWRVVLLYKKEPNWRLETYFDEVRPYKNEWDALSIASGYAPVAFHVFSMWADRTSRTFIRHKPGKVVFDSYDASHGLMSDPVIGRRGRTFYYSVLKYCLEHADGLCCRDLQCKYIERTERFALARRLIFFPEYCWDIDGGNEPRRSDGEIRVVQIGSFGIEKLGQGFFGCLDIAEKLTSQGIHFHIYVHPHWDWLSDDGFEEVFSEYLALERRNPFFHLHRSLPIVELLKELSKYDIGMAGALIYEEEHPFTKEQLAACGSSRIVDYMDAALPVLSNKELALQFFILKRYGAVIDMTREMLENAREYLLPLACPETKERIKKSRSAYSIKANIGRLISFYESLK